MSLPILTRPSINITHSNSLPTKLQNDTTVCATKKYLIQIVAEEKPTKLFAFQDKTTPAPLAAIEETRDTQLRRPKRREAIDLSSYLFN